MENDLPCPKCGNDFQTGPSWNEDESLIWWDCECGLEGPEAQTQRDAIRLWNDMVTAMSSNVQGQGEDTSAACGRSPAP